MGSDSAGRFCDAGMGRQHAFGLALLGGPLASVVNQWGASSMSLNAYIYSINMYVRFIYT